MFNRYSLLSLLAALLLTGTASAHKIKEDNSWWWSDAWWENGIIREVTNLPVKVEQVSYKSGENKIPAMVARPDDNKKYPAVLFQHGRRGLDFLIQKHVKRLAARGFVVYAPDIYTGRFVEPYPIEHDYSLEDDVNNAVDALLARKDISSKRACTYSHTRGGYYTLKVAVTKKRQVKDLACYVSYYPHMQDPNAAEPMQVYRYALEADELKIPVLIFIGDEEQYQRRRGIESAIASLQEKKRDARLIIYPGVGRGFDFRPENVRTFADDLAAKDAIQRASDFMRKHLK